MIAITLDNELGIVPKLIREEALEGTVYLQVRHERTWKDHGLILEAEKPFHEDYWLRQRNVTGVMFMRHHYIVGFDITQEGQPS